MRPYRGDPLSMTMNCNKLSLALLLSALPAQQAAQPGPRLPAAVRLYRQALAKSIARAQAELHQQLDLRVDHSTWADPWHIKTENIEVVIAGSYGAGMAIARDQEELLASMIALIKPGFAAGEPFKIFVTPGINEYNALNSGAGARSSIYASFYDAAHAERPVITYRQQNSTLMRMAITHGLSNAFLQRAFPNQNHPAWLDEGLGSYFALWWSQTWAAEELARMIEQGQFIPLARLLDDPIGSYTAADTQARFIELGMLFNYLLHYRQDTRSELVDGEMVAGDFARYLQARARGDELGDAISARLLSSERAALATDFKATDFSGR